MRNYKNETKNRIKFIRSLLADAHADGIVYGNSGGKDSTLVGILCKMACDDTVGVIMPCESKQNYGTDKTDAEAVAKECNIEVRLLDLTKTKKALLHLLENETPLHARAAANIAPRLRMTALYAVASSENRLVAGTGNRSERHMGYFTKWGDGACDFNPIGDLTVTEVYEFLKFLNAPENIIAKPPSAGLFDGQTDEQDMGITYERIDRFILDGVASKEDQEIIARYHNASGHKRRLPPIYGQD